MSDFCEEERKASLRRARQRKYKQTPKGKATQKRYWRGPKGKATQARFEQSPECREIRARYKLSPEGKAANRRARLLAKYGLTARQYDLMFERQGGVCVHCKRPPKTQRLAVEHDHHTSRVRGLACYNCNRHLIAKNTAETARWLVDYLSSDFDGRQL